MLQNQREIAENYLLKFILTAQKCNKLFCHWTCQFLTKKNIKIIKNVSVIALILANTGPETFCDQKEIFNILIKTTSAAFLRFR